MEQGSFLHVLISLKGRINRSTYWIYYIALIVLGLVASSVGGNATAPADPSTYVIQMLGVEFELSSSQGLVGGLLTFIFVIGVFWIYIAICVKRLHDMDSSGLWLLTVIIPGVVLILFVVFGVVRGTNGVNPHYS